MKLIRTEDAAGQVLCHDITQIIPGEFKGARFRKGHIIQPEDIPVLLSIGKENLYVWEKKPGILHEDEAAALLYKAAAGKNIHGTEPKEGKIELIADCDGLLKINREALLAVNRTPQMMIATIHGDLPVKKGQKLAGTRIIPLVIEQEKMDAMQAAAGSEPILNVLPMQAKKFAVITTGSEVFKGRIEDKFTPILVGKLAEYGCEMTFHKVCDDDPAGITTAILEAKEAGCELIFTTGGMSVDPDDRTPLAIRNTGADIVTYGAPVLPGAMFLVSFWTVCRSAVCPAASCTPSAPSLTCCCPVCWPTMPSPPRILPVWARVVSALAASSATGPTADLGIAERFHSMTDNKLTHFDASGNAVMVDVSEKTVTFREATARGIITMNAEAFAAVESGTVKKGDVLGVARIAGIMATKRTSELIPLCHPLPLTKVSVDFRLLPERQAVEALCTVKTAGVTGVEMEALTGVSTALLTIYDMCKAVDKGMELGEIHLVEKTGGKSGHYIRAEGGYV